MDWLNILNDFSERIRILKLRLDKFEYDSDSLPDLNWMCCILSNQEHQNFEFWILNEALSTLEYFIWFESFR